METQLKIKEMSGITEKNGIPYIWGVPCIKDTEYRFSVNKFPATIWLCPHCLQNLSFENDYIFCVRGCHLEKNINRNSFFLKYYEDDSSLKRLGNLFKRKKQK